MEEGRCIIFSAPSGAGKTTIVKHLLSLNFGLEFSISATSRKIRGEEVNGKDYYFLSPEEFKAKIKNDEFLEWEEVYKDNFYGTLRSEIDRIWRKGNTVVFDVDVIGGLSLKSVFQELALAVFIMPPSVEEIEKRLRNRGTETEEKIQQRLDKAVSELTKANEFDCIVMNDNLTHAKKDAEFLVSKFLAKKA